MKAGKMAEPTQVWRRCALLSRTGGVCALTMTLALVVGCKEKKGVDNPTSGYIITRCSEEVLPMMMEEAYAFMDLYSKAKILVLGGGSDIGLASIFVDSAQIAVSTREMTGEEKKRAGDAGFDLHEFKLCKDGIAVVVNPGNPVRVLTTAQVVDIFTGKIRNWSKVGGPSLPIRVAIWDENSGTYPVFRDSILKGEYVAGARRFGGTEDIAKFIEKERGAIGIVSMARLYTSWSPLVEDTRIRALEISRGAKGSPVFPDEETVHSGRYPYDRYVYLYTPREPKGLDGGFISFLLSSAGQKIAAANGYVPAAVPVEYKRENP